MKRISIRKNAFNATCCVAFVLGIIFATAAFLITLFIPVFDPAPVETVEAPIEDEFEEITPYFDNVGMLTMFGSDDEGLVFYRNDNSRKAVERFYKNVAGNNEIAMAILAEADNNDIALSLAFALAYVESRFNVKASNVNKNRTIDRGLFQLNSGSFPNLTEPDFYNPAVSAKHGMAHLRFCLDTAGNEISALAMYNAGANKVRANNTPQLTLNYIGQIMTCRDTIDRLFDEKVKAYYDYGNQYLSDAVQVALAK